MSEEVPEDFDDEIIDRTLIPGAFFALFGFSVPVKSYSITVVSFICIFAYIIYLEEYY